jgi:NhaA family Na+:H+ antiporter
MPSELIRNSKKRRKFTLINFIHDSRSVGILLLFSTILSLIVTNIPTIGNSYHNFWEAEIPLLHSLNLPHTFLHIINDVLMAVFFFQVGMEIKHETISGEFSVRRRMILPVVAAICGVIVPAIIYSSINAGTPFQKGWAIPTATDIAFSLGILSLLGNAVPHSLKIFLTTLAIADDLCAILIIALFYGSQVSLIWLAGAAICTIALFFIIRKFRSATGRILTAVGAIALWLCLYRSGIHATFAGVILALLLPERKIHIYGKKIHIPVNFFILPLFALANTSILISAASMGNLISTLSLGIFLGLFLGKPIGIMLAVFFLSKSKIIKLNSSDWVQFMGVGILAGIGFTMSIFVSTLAFSDKNIQDTAKLAVLVTSGFSMIVGYLWLKIVTRSKKLQQK